MAMIPTKKTLKKLRLVNWHRFDNETIEFDGATLITGENAAGKSTILDAIKMVLTVDTHQFNIAADEKSKRDLLGYVRCKLGQDDRSFRREGVVVSHVALEFYDEEKKRSFVLGVVHTSQDELSKVQSKWYVVECDLDGLNFIVGNKPATVKELRPGIQPLERKDAQDRFRIRLGHLQERFFEMIRKAIAFKPMGKVKEFINQFLLPEANVDFESLKENIANVRKLEKWYHDCLSQKEQLDAIIIKAKEYTDKQHEILVNDILMDLARYDDYVIKLNQTEGNINRIGRKISETDETKAVTDGRKTDAEQRLLETRIALNDSDSGKILSGIMNHIKELKASLGQETIRWNNYRNQLKVLKAYLIQLKANGFEPLNSQEYAVLEQAFTKDSVVRLLDKLDSFDESEGSGFEQKLYNVGSKISEIQQKISDLDVLRRNLEQKQHLYPSQHQKFKTLVETECRNKGINANACFLCELLDIKNEEWREAVEGVLGDRRFSLVVDADAIPVAKAILLQASKDGVSLVDPADISDAVVADDVNTLASHVNGSDWISRGFISRNFGDIKCCERISDLENCSNGVTKSCVWRHNDEIEQIDKRLYETPYIGMNAYEIQLRKVLEDLEQYKANLKQKQIEKDLLKNLCKARTDFIKQDIRQNADSNQKKLELEQEIREQEDLEKKTRNNPDFIQFTTLVDKLGKQVNELGAESDSLGKKLIDLKADAKHFAEELSQNTQKLASQKDCCQYLEEEHPSEYMEANDKYSYHKKDKDPSTTIENFRRRRVALTTESEQKMGELKRLQSRHNQQFTADMPEGVEQISDYVELQRKLNNIVIRDRKDAFEKANKHSEEIFKTDFLAKMKEHIGIAKGLFKDLNNTLKLLSYGEDTYSFVIQSNRDKESFYRMITDESNQGDGSLWDAAFKEKYQSEMDDLYGKLLSDRESDESIIREYSDYRTYLDYDIKITKANGAVLTYSKVAGEKSGAETQVPFYVAIAASFYILYQQSGSIRLMLFDEAFNKMDESRIETMMDFYKTLGMQTIVVTPPEKLQSIGPYVDSVLVVCKDEDCSYVMDNGYAEEDSEQPD